MMSQGHDSRTEFHKFDEAMKQILSVSRHELKKREEAWKRKRAKKKRVRKKPASPGLAAGRPVSG